MKANSYAPETLTVCSSRGQQTVPGAAISEKMLSLRTIYVLIKKVIAFK